MKIDLNLTREQFLEMRSISIYCPSYFKLESEFNSNNCDGEITCDDCWKNAVGGMKFRGEK